MSENATSWNHLWLYDAKNGKVKNQITKGEWVVRGVKSISTLRKGGFGSPRVAFSRGKILITSTSAGLILMALDLPS